MVVALPWILAIITYTIPEAPGIHHGWSINIFPFLSPKEENIAKSEIQKHHRRHGFTATSQLATAHC